MFPISDRATSPLPRDAAVRRSSSEEYEQRNSDAGAGDASSSVRRDSRQPPRRTVASWLIYERQFSPRVPRRIQEQLVALEQRRLTEALDEAGAAAFSDRRLLGDIASSASTDPRMFALLLHMWSTLPYPERDAALPALRHAARHDEALARAVRLREARFPADEPDLAQALDEYFLVGAPRDEGTDLLLNLWQRIPLADHVEHVQALIDDYPANPWLHEALAWTSVASAESSIETAARAILRNSGSVTAIRGLVDSHTLCVNPRDDLLLTTEAIRGMSDTNARHALVEYALRELQRDETMVRLGLRTIGGIP